MSLLWHYTVNLDSHLGSILRDGVVLREGEKGTYQFKKKLYTICNATWFSSNQLWENTVTKFSRPIPISEMLTRFAARIGVEHTDRYLSWPDFKRRRPGLAGASKKKLEMARMLFVGLEKSGIQIGSDPNEWFASLDRVYRDEWKSVQIRKDDQWVELEGWQNPLPPKAKADYKILVDANQQPIRFGQNKIFNVHL